MSMISNLVKELRDYSKLRKGEISSLTLIAAETIEALSEKAREPKKGEWIRDGHHIRCKECGVCFCDKDREGDAYPQNFCPNCGARMKGADDEA